ncbi:MAG TPA: HDIG domain-containing protein, partial [Thermoanaerobaculia bacterium]|nr:HDIG domain-containing protein [Thermoanaerobaculia bacterium]
MPATKPSTARLHLLPASRRRRFWRRLELRRAWDRLLELPWVWVLLLVAAGGAALTPGVWLAPLLASHLAPGTVAGRDYVASRDLMLFDAAATRAKQDQARARVLPVYDFDPGVQTLRDAQLADLFAAGRQRLPGARDEAARSALVRELARTAAAAPAAAAAGPSGGAAPAAAAPPATVAPPAATGAPTAAGAAGPSGGVADALKLEPEQVEALLRKGFSAESEDRLRGAMDGALRRGVVENKALLLENRMTGIVLRNLADGSERVQVSLFDHLGYPEETRDFLESEVRGWSGFTAAERRRLVGFLVDNLSPNLHLNRSETLARRDLAEAGAGQAFTQIRKGQVIARKGDIIDEAKARLIETMRGRGSPRSRLPEAAGTLLLLALAAAALWLGLAGERVAGHSRRRLFAESALLLTGALLGARLGFQLASALSASVQVPPFNAWRGYVLALPFAALPLSAALLLRRHVALLLAVVCSLLVGRMAIEGEPLAVALYAFAGSLAAIFAVDRLQFRQRLVMPRAGLVVGGVNVLLALIVSALAGDTDLLTAGFELVCAFGGGLLAAAVASFAVPVLEPLLGITTDIKLVEISNTNLPLLRRLAFEAPGTFQHSLMVANLAKEGCEAIGADAVLAYTGALYHDIGKVFRSDYFIENQRPGQNRHDRLLPSMSALVLVNHVKEGAELARQHHLPQVIVDAIEQHHGTRLMRFFYNRAREQNDRAAGEVREADYRYPGPRPRNKVMAVLMLADGVEAASRTLTDPTTAKLRGLIGTLFDDCLQDGQLDKTDLTLSDLRAVSEAFLRVLSTIYHQRV